MAEMRKGREDWSSKGGVTKKVPAVSTWDSLPLVSSRASAEFFCVVPLQAQ